MLFGTARQQSPKVLVFDDSEAIRAASIDLEVVSENLLPATTAARNFDEVR